MPQMKIRIGKAKYKYWRVKQITAIIQKLINSPEFNKNYKNKYFFKMFNHKEKTQFQK